MIDLDAIKARLARVAKKWPTTGVLAPGADEFGPRAWAAHGPLRCHATEQGSARGWTQANADADFIAHAPGDISALVAEVEAARTEAATMRSWAEEAAKAENENAEDAKRERAAVVAWLRYEAEAAAQTFTLQAGEWAKRIDDLADDIERGEHHRGDEMTDDELKQRIVIVRPQPNLQNIPIRTDEGRRILDLFRRVGHESGEHRREEKP